MKRVVILGSTGSIGTQTLDVVRQHADRIQIVGLAAQRNGAALLQQATEFGVSKVALYDEAAAHQAGVPGGMSALIDLATKSEADIVVISVAGVIGLEPTLAAIQAGKQIALASKEVLVAGGELVMTLAKQHGVPILPIDSEHSAIFQCLLGAPGPSNRHLFSGADIEELILTASGGPFRGRSLGDLAAITVEQALNHPTWRMGGKITIDSATLMNKGLESIEAKWLFDVEIEQVKVVVHPQSIVHSMVKLRDGSVLGQMGWPDMRLPIQLALLFPERVPSGLRPWNPVESPTLTFEPVDEDTFRCLRLARESASVGGTMPCVMNAANEEAANAFLRSEIGFLQIAEVVSATMEAHSSVNVTLEALLETDSWAREAARSQMLALSR